jgi:hypothetical protein
MTNEGRGRQGEREREREAEEEKITRAQELKQNYELISVNTIQ